MQTDYDCSCWCDYPNNNHRYYGCSDTPKKNGKWKCVDCYEYVGKSRFGATHCRRKVEIMNIDEGAIDSNAIALMESAKQQEVWYGKEDKVRDLQR